MLYQLLRIALYLGPPSHLNLESFEQSTGGDDDDDLSIKRANGEKPNCNESRRIKKSSQQSQRDDDDDDDELINLEGDAQGHHDTTEHNVVVVNNGSDEESKQTGVVRWRVYTVYWRAVGNCLALCVLLSLFLMQGDDNFNITLSNIFNDLNNSTLSGTHEWT